MTERMLEILKKGMDLVASGCLKRADLDLGEFDASVYKINAATMRIDISKKESMRD